MNENSILSGILIGILCTASNVIKGKVSTAPRDDEKRQQQISSPDSGCVNRRAASSAQKISFSFLEPVIGAINKR